MLYIFLKSHLPYLVGSGGYYRDRKFKAPLNRCQMNEIVTIKKKSWYLPTLSIGSRLSIITYSEVESQTPLPPRPLLLPFKYFNDKNAGGEVWSQWNVNMFRQSKYNAFFFSRSVTGKQRSVTSTEFTKSRLNQQLNHFIRLVTRSRLDSRAWKKTVTHRLLGSHVLQIVMGWGQLTALLSSAM